MMKNGNCYLRKLKNRLTEALSISLCLLFILFMFFCFHFELEYMKNESENKEIKKEWEKWRDISLERHLEQNPDINIIEALEKARDEADEIMEKK